MEVARVHTYGVDTYWEGSWREVPNAEKRFLNARGRHILEESDVRDKKTNLLVAAHIAWNALAVLHFTIERLENDPSNHQSHP